MLQHSHSAPPYKKTAEQTYLFHDLTSVRFGRCLFLKRPCDSHVSSTQLYACLVHGTRSKLTEPVPLFHCLHVGLRVPGPGLFCSNLFHQLCVMSALFLECSLGQTKARRATGIRNRTFECSTLSFTPDQLTFLLTDRRSVAFHRRSASDAQAVMDTHGRACYGYS